MKNLLFKTAGIWVFLVFLLFSCSDSLEESVIESDNIETQLANKEMVEQALTDDLKKKGENASGNGKGVDDDPKTNNGKSEENKGKGKDKDHDSEDADSDEDATEEDESEDADSDEDATEEDESEDDNSDEDATEKDDVNGNNGKSEENKGRGKDKDQDDDSEDADSDEDATEEDESEDADSDEDATEEADVNENKGKSEENKGKGKDKEDETTDDDNEATADFRTQTIGGWGSKPNGNNSGIYLHDNFESTFPAGVIIGGGELTVSFTSAQAITDFLPSGSKAKVLAESFVDPTAKELRNNFVSQLLAATISISFDEAITDYSKSETLIKNLVIAEGELAGLQVSEVISMANKALSGQETEYTINQLHDALSSINESYVDGKTSSGFLTSK